MPKRIVPGGTRKHPLYERWCGMKQRCYNPKHPSYKNYGGRGITVCEAWRTSFLQFVADMGSPPGAGYEVDREKNHLGYNPDNCRWVTRKTNMNNTRANRMVKYLDQTWRLEELCLSLGLSYRSVRWRLDMRGLSLEEAISGKERKNAMAVEFRGQTKTVQAWCEELQLAYHTVRSRLYNGWSPEEALTNTRNPEHVARQEAHQFKSRISEPST
jgi:hypothetical protein